jgi:hypothetical protein
MIPQAYPLYVTVQERPFLVVGWIHRQDISHTYPVIVPLDDKTGAPWTYCGPEARYSITPPAPEPSIDLDATVTMPAPRWPYASHPAAGTGY